MKKNPVVLIAIGVVLLLVGGVMQFTGGPPRADPALVQACEASMRDRGAPDELIRQCTETAFASAMTATDAQSAAQAISTANSSEIGGNMIAMFFLGLGLALTAGGVLLLVARRRAGPDAA